MVHSLKLGIGHYLDYANEPLLFDDFLTKISTDFFHCPSIKLEYKLQS